jgi:hypothetical protein
VSDLNKTTVKLTVGFCINSILTVYLSVYPLSLYLCLCRVLMRNNDVNAWFPGLSQSGIQRGQMFKKPGEMQPPRRKHLYTAKTKYRNFETNIPRKGISGPQSQFPHSYVCE